MTDSNLKLTWHIAEVTPEITRKATSLQKAIKEACEIAPEDANALINYTYYVTATRKLDYPPTARTSVRALATFLERWTTLSPAQVWEFHQVYLSHKLKQVWDEAFDDAQNLCDPDPAEVPEFMLSESEREALKDPDSFLAPRVGSSG